MADATRLMTVVFKTDRTSFNVGHYMISQEELTRLAKDFQESSSGVPFGAYEVIDDKTPRLLMLRFADVLYIC